MIANLLERERVNIKNLAIEVPQRGQFTIPVFDPEKELTQEMWEKISDELDYLAIPNRDIKNRTERYIQHLTEVSLAFPSKMSQIQMSKGERKRFLEKVSNFNTRDIRHGYQIAKYALSVKQLFPELNYQDIVGQDGLENMEDELLSEAQQKRDYWMNGPIIATDMRLLFPRHRITRGENEILEYLKWGALRLKHDPERYMQSLAYLAALRLHFPEEFRSIHLDKQLWEELKKPFFRFPDVHIGYAFHLKIFSAKEIIFRNSGIELAMTNGPAANLGELSSPFPNIRRF